MAGGLLIFAAYKTDQMNTIAKYASFVKFSHTIFAMPFALIGYAYAILNKGYEFEWLLLVKILFCMVFARNAAMGFNRWADRKIDAENPRTADREIPSGQISPKAALFFVTANAAGFLIVAGFINRLTLMLAPLALFIILGYSFTKRFTAWSHLVLGTALAIAPAGAYIAVTGTLALIPVLLAGLVASWVAGFDILYSLQDAEHDKKHGLHSVPSKFSATGAVVISAILHLVTIYAVLIIGYYLGKPVLYWIGSVFFIGLLILQHFVFFPNKELRIAAWFGIINGVSSIIYAAFTIWAMA